MNKLKFAYIYIFLGRSDLLPVFEAEWKSLKGSSVLVKCVAGKINEHYTTIFSAQKGLEIHCFWVQ